MAAKDAAKILIGTSNWTVHDDFYPPELEPKSRQSERISFYAQFFPIVEVDATFYRILPARTMDGWARRTPDAFTFDVKAYRGLTGHERQDGRPRRPRKREARDFVGSLQPLREAGKLGAILYQLPPWLQRGSQGRTFLQDARERHPDDLVAVEFRHRSWFGEAWEETKQLLREIEAVYVAADSPSVGSGAPPRLFSVTNRRLAIVRFHGRDAKTWYQQGETSAERFNYSYQPKQFREWLAKVEEATSLNTPLHLLISTNHGNQGPVNAYKLASAFGVQLPPPPEPVRKSLRWHRT